MSHSEGLSGHFPQNRLSYPAFQLPLKWGPFLESFPCFIPDFKYWFEYQLQNHNFLKYDVLLVPGKTI